MLFQLLIKKEKQDSPSKGSWATHYTYVNWREQSTQKQPRKFSYLGPQSEDYQAEPSAEAQNSELGKLCTALMKEITLGTSLAVQWLGLCTSTTGGTGSIPGLGTKIPHALRHGRREKKKKKKEGNHL